MASISVKNGGPTRKGENKKTPKTKESRNRHSGSRKLEPIKRKEVRVATNVELTKDGLYTCAHCKEVSLIRISHRTSRRLGSFHGSSVVDDLKIQRIVSGVAQESGDGNPTRSPSMQRVIKASLQDKDGYDEYCEECDAANPPKPDRKTRHTKEEMKEKSFLVWTMV